MGAKCDRENREWGMKNGIFRSDRSGEIDKR
jgi:hypothetical protein